MLSCAHRSSCLAFSASHASVSAATGLCGTLRLLRSASFDTKSNRNGGTTNFSSSAEPRLVSSYSFISCTSQDVNAFKDSPAVRALLEKVAQEKRSVTLQELSRVAGETRLLSSPMHDAMLSRIERHARMVTSGGVYGQPLLEGDSGVDVSCVFVSEEGGGKSTCLKAGARLLPLVHPSLVTVYCDMSKAAHRGELHDPLFIERLLVSALVQSGVDTPRSTVPLLRIEGAPHPRNVPMIRFAFFEEMNADLQAADKRLLLMLDVFEHLFQADEEEFETRCSIVEAVALLANSFSGRTVLELCGSSAHLRSLLFARAGQRELETIAEMYPVVKATIILNGSRIPSICLPSALPNDIEAVKNMLRMWMEENSFPSLQGTAQVADTVIETLQSEEGLEKVASLCLFRAGSTAREVRRVVKELHLEPVRQETPTVHAAVYNQVMNVLVKKNEDLLDMVKGEIHFSPPWHS